MRLQMLIDATKCMNCQACVLACRQRNNVPAGNSRNWVRQLRVHPDNAEGLTPLSGIHYQPGSCMQCADALCLRACPTKATYAGEDGVIYVDAERCIGCGACADACPYDARFRHPHSGAMDKCDYCASSRSLTPACVNVCPTRARIFGDADNADSPVAKALAEAGTNISRVESKATPTKPQLVYLGQTAPKDWPREGSIPAPLALMEPSSTGVKWLGGAAVLGVLLTALRNK